MKNNCLKRFNVRLNLKKPDHRKAWEILRSTGTSYTETIVNVLNARQENRLSPELLSALSSLVRDAVSDALLNVSPASFPIHEDVPDSAPISDEDFDIANEFMSSL